MIARIKITNFKSIQDAELNFKQTNAFIGKNGAGKTTLMLAVNILQRFISGENINNIANDIAPFGEFFNSNTDSKKATFCFDIISPQKHIYTYSFTIVFGSRTGHATKKYYIDDESLFLKDEDGDKLIFRRNSSDDILRITNIQTGDGDGEVPLRVASTTSVLSVYATPEAKDVSDTVSSYSIIWMDQSTDSAGMSLISANNLDLSTIDGVAINLFLKDRELYDKAMKSIESIIPGFSSPIIQKIDPPAEQNGNSKNDSDSVSNFILYWKDNNYSKLVNISQLSLSGGNSRVIYIILSLYNSDSRSCFVAEEIENGMHLERISKLIEQVKMIAKNRSIQIFFTTHNHMILNYLLPDEVIFTKLTDAGSKYERLNDTEEFKDIKEALGRAPSSSEIVDSGLLNI